MVAIAGANTAAATKVPHHQRDGRRPSSWPQTTMSRAAQSMTLAAMKNRAAVSSDARRVMVAMGTARKGIAVQLASRCGWPVAQASSPPRYASPKSAVYRTERASGVISNAGSSGAKRRSGTRCCGDVAKVAHMVAAVFEETGIL